MILVFGGAFNPITLAHENIVKGLLQEFEVGFLFIVPVGDHYNKASLLNYDTRIKLIKLALDDLSPKVKILDYEKDEPYLGTYSMLKKIKSDFNDDIYFIMGADNLCDLPNWRNLDLLLKEFKFIIIKRNGYKVNTSLLDEKNASYKVINFDSDISSSLIRRKIDENKEYLNKKVYNYIKENHLYEQEGDLDA